MITGFEKYHDEIELHVFSPHSGMKKQFQKFSNDNTHYYFYKSDLPIIHRHWPNFLPLDKLTRYLKQRIFVFLEMKRINPDIVFLIGAENIRSSSTALWLKKLNICSYVLIQGIISDPAMNVKGNGPNKIQIKMERKIHRTFKYFGIGAPYFCDLILRDNPEPVFLKAQAPRNIQMVDMRSRTNKDFDFVFFGRVDENKGIEDLIEALARVKKEKSDVSLQIIGRCKESYLLYLKEKINALGVAENIKFTGYLPTIDEVHREAVNARFYVLPTKIEGMASSVIESMMLGLPVITCRTGGLPYLNKDGMTVLMSEPGDIEGLANNMLKLLRSPELANILRNKAKEFAYREFGIEKIADTFVQQIRAIMDNYHHGIPIPDDLLFHADDFQN